MEIAELERNLRNTRIVLMPDFFLDHFVYWPGNFEGLVARLGEVVGRGGGNISASQDFALGGCAARTARVLSLLGVTPVLLTRTSPLGLKFLEYFFAASADLSLVRTDGELALTAALETAEANVMLNDVASIREFSRQALAGTGELLRRADAVAVFSWNFVEEGTSLAQEVFSMAAGLKFLDTGDPTLRSRQEAEDLLRKVRPDVWSMNENEARYFGSFFGASTDPRAAADILWRHDIGVVLHTRDFAYRPPEHLAPSFPVAVRRATGAGDCWNAGYLAARVSALSAGECLTLANAVAACWVAGQEISWANVAAILETR